MHSCILLPAQPWSVQAVSSLVCSLPEVDGLLESSSTCHRACVVPTCSVHRDTTSSQASVIPPRGKSILWLTNIQPRVLKLSHWSGTGPYNPDLEGILHTGIFTRPLFLPFFPPFYSFSCFISAQCEALERERGCFPRDYSCMLLAC